MPPKKHKITRQENASTARESKKVRIEPADELRMTKEALDLAQNEIAQLRNEVERLRQRLHSADQARKRYYNDAKRMKRKAGALYSKYRFWYKSCFQVNASRLKWKARRQKSQRNLWQPRKTTLTADEDILFMVQFNITGNERKRMKAFMRKHGVDFFAKSQERTTRIEEISPSANWTYNKEVNRGVLYRSNIDAEIKTRIKRLIEGEKLKLEDEPTELYFCILGDKGGEITKIAMFPLNVKNANDPDNLSLLCIYKGKDSADELRLFGFETFTQLNKLAGKKYTIETTDNFTYQVELRFVLAGDMPFLLNIYGIPHAWTSKNPCLFCLTTKKELNVINAQRRTLLSMVDAYNKGKQRFFPELAIPIENAVPSTLHIFLGVASDYFKEIEDLATIHDDLYPTRIYDRIQVILLEHQIDKNAWYMTFTGNQIKKLIGTPEIMLKIQQLFPDDWSEYPDVCHYVDLMLILGKVQKCAKAEFLQEDDKLALKSSIDELNSKIHEIPNPRITPKLHWLLAHVNDFVMRHGFWGLSSEQGIESLHHKINQDLRRFCAIKNEEKLLRQIARVQDLRTYFFDKK